MKFTFVADPNNPKAVRAQKECIKRYGQEDDLAKTDVVVPLSGDGGALQILQALLALQTVVNYRVPVLGMHFGHVGALMNQYSLDNLPDRVEKAERQEITPLRISMRTGLKKVLKQYAFNEFSFTRMSPQAARLEVVVQDRFGELVRREVFGDGLIVATSLGTSGYYASAHGVPIDVSQDVMALQSVCAKRGFNAIIAASGAQVDVRGKELQKRPICVDQDGQTRTVNVRSATIRQDPNKTMILLRDRKRDSIGE